jgi:hypothetical protein
MSDVKPGLRVLEKVESSLIISGKFCIDVEYPKPPVVAWLGELRTW